MKQIDQTTMQRMLNEGKAGYFCFMGGASEEGMPLIIGTKDKFYLLEGEEYQKNGIPDELLESMKQDAEEYAKSME